MHLLRMPSLPAPQKVLMVVIQLSRVREYVLQLSLIFPMVSIIAPSLLMTARTLLTYIANVLLTGFTYSFNDVEDAEDDSLDPCKAARNPISSGKISKRAGYLLSIGFLFAGLSVLAILSIDALLSGSLFSVNSALYSWRRMRLKSIPLLDLLSHAMALGVHQLVVTYLAFRPPDFALIPLAAMVGLFSMASQISQQIRDFDVDRLAGVRNTTQVVGPRRAKVLMLTMLFAASASYVWAVKCLALDPRAAYAAPLGVILPLLYFRLTKRIRFSAATRALPSSSPPLLE
ncbi:MAG TPA: hypothetical protein ENG69_01660 [Candidatus Korarchaeota archaeon]|nr:hypothetical protein [Candidatus Korarchaeota archaeon]